jgi:hypothetical protein
MKRLALIAAAPLVVAVVLAVTSIYRPGSDGDGGAATATTTAPAAATAAEPPPGALVLGGRAGDLAVGLAVRRTQADGLDLEASVLGPDGTGVENLDIVFTAGDEEAAGRPCGGASYCASVPVPTPTRVSVRVETKPRARATFDIPRDWRSGTTLVEKATEAFNALETVRYDERLSSGAGTTLNSTWQVAAPDRLAYEITGGASAVVIGDHRWDRSPGEEWIESPQDPLALPAPPWTRAVENASVLGSATIQGHDTWIVSFLDQAGLPTWFTLWIDKETGRTLELSMTTASHFMRQTYTGFNRPVEIVPPR